MRLDDAPFGETLRSSYKERYNMRLKKDRIGHRGRKAAVCKADPSSAEASVAYVV